MIERDTLRCGQGHPVLLLHGFRPLAPDAPFLRRLGESCDITAPSHPGFGNSPRLDEIETMYDLMQFYLAWLERWETGTVSLVGLSFGGWLAAELAVVASHRLRRLVLVDPVGIRLSRPDTPDILDIFNTDAATVARHAWHDAARAPENAAMSDAARQAWVRDREALCRYAWNPYLHNPRLRHWLHRIAVPSLLLWGASDGIVTPAYGAAYAGLIPGARLALIEGAGHHPELEQPERCADAIAAFLA